MIVVLGLRLHVTKTVLLHTDDDKDALTHDHSQYRNALDNHGYRQTYPKQEHDAAAQTNDSAARPDSVGAAVLRTGASSNGQQRVAIVIMRGNHSRARGASRRVRRNGHAC